MTHNKSYHGYHFNLNGEQILVVCAKRAKGYVLAQAIADAINGNQRLLCTASVGENNDIDIVGWSPPVPVDVDVKIIFNHGEAP